MPISPRQTHKGIPLRSEAKGGGNKETIGEIPPEWRCALDLSILDQPVPYDTEIPLLSDTILSTRVEQTFTSESTLHQVTKPPGIVTLEETYTDKFKQVGSRIKKFRPITDLPLIGLPSATRDVNTKNFGNYHFEETLEDSGTLFTQQEYTVERPDSAPEKFKELLPLTTESHVELGLATLPVLGDSEYIKSEGQQDVYTKKVSTRYRDPINFPAHLTTFRMTPEQQIAEGIDTLDDEALNIGDLDVLTVEAMSEDLGDGTWYRTKFDVPSVFSHQSYSKSRDLFASVPPEFRTALTESGQSDEEAGVVHNLPLSGTETYRKEEQLTKFKKRVETRNIDLTGGSEIVDYRMTPEQQLETITKDLLDSAPTPSTFDALTVESEIRTLGGGFWLEVEGTVPDVFTKQVYETSRPEVWPERFRALVPLSTDSHVEDGVAAPPTLGTVDVRKSEQQETVFKKKVETSIRDLSSLPTTHLQGQKYEDTFDLVLPYDEWIDTAGVNIGTPRAVVTPQGDGTEQVEQIDYSSISDALNAYSLVFPGVTTLNGKLPDILSDVVSVFEVNSGNGTYSETGAGYWSIRGSYSLTIRGSGNGSAAVVSDASFLLVPPFFPVKPTTRAVFFLPTPVTPGAVQTRLTAIMGSSVSAWPNFQPKPVTVVCTSKKVSVKAEANQHTQSGGSAITGPDGDPCTEADCTSCDASSTSGTGTSTEVGLTIKTIRIPPSIHDAIALHDHQDEGATARAYAFDGSSWGSCVPPEFGAADTGTIDLTATGKVDCDAPATPFTMYPTSGLHLLDASAQPYKYGFAMIHTEVFDFADL